MAIKKAAKKSPSKKAASTSKSAAKKTTTKKSAAKKTSSRKYSPAASKSVEREMKAMEAGELKTSAGKKVTNPRQAIAIGLSEARRAGKKVPPNPNA
jgi:hypothetical protein